MANPKLKYRGESTLNRAYEKRRDNDILKAPSITIYDVDYAIMHWLREEIGFQVQENGRMINVPVMYANSETWAQVQANGYMRDVEGKLLTPYCTIRRTNMSEDPRFKKLDLNKSTYGSSYKFYTEGLNLENQRNQHAKTYNTKPSLQYLIQVMPEFYIVEYELLLWTSLVEQMNTLIENIIPTSNFAWGDELKFITVVGDIGLETVNTPGEERLVRANIPLTVDAKLLNEFELKKSTVEKAFTLKRVVVQNERSSFDAITHDVSDQFPTHNKNRR